MAWSGESRPRLPPSPRATITALVASEALVATGLVLNTDSQIFSRCVHGAGVPLSGRGYGRMDNFTRVYRETLRQVKAAYPEAKFDLDGEGMRLHHSRPPVPPKSLPVS